MSMSRREIIEGILLVLIVVLAASAVLYWASPEEMRRIQSQYLKQPDLINRGPHVNDKTANATGKEIKLPLPKTDFYAEERLRGAFPHVTGNLDSSISPGATNRHEIFINSFVRDVIACFSDAKLRLVLINPDGISIDSLTASDVIGIYYSNPGTSKGRFAAYAFFTKNIPPGKWIVEITNDNTTGNRANYNIGVYY
jgi:hypothetical protein